MDARRKNRILYCSWLTENRRVDKEQFVESIPEPAIDFESLDQFDPDELERLVLKRQGEEVAERVNIAVQSAAAQLSENEREFLARFYNMGESYRQMSEKSGRTIHSLESLHNRAKRKLRKLLAKFVREEFGVVASAAVNCPICLSIDRTEIDRLLAEHQPASTWRKELRILREKYGLSTVTPQTIIGHQKYHS